MKRVIFYEVDLEHYDIMEHDEIPFTSSNILDITARNKLHVVDSKQVKDPSFIIYDGSHYYTFISLLSKL